VPWWIIRAWPRLRLVGKQHEVKGQVICAFVSLRAGIESSPSLVDELRGHVAKKIGAIA